MGELYEVDHSLAQACGCIEIIGVAPMGEGAVLVGYDTSSGHQQPAVMIWPSQ